MKNINDLTELKKLLLTIDQYKWWATFFLTLLGFVSLVSFLSKNNFELYFDLSRLPIYGAFSALVVCLFSIFLVAPYLIRLTQRFTLSLHLSQYVDCGRRLVISLWVPVVLCIAGFEFGFDLWVIFLVVWLIICSLVFLFWPSPISDFREAKGFLVACGLFVFIGTYVIWLFANFYVFVIGFFFLGSYPEWMSWILVGSFLLILSLPYFLFCISKRGYDFSVFFVAAIVAVGIFFSGPWRIGQFTLRLLNVGGGMKVTFFLKNGEEENVPFLLRSYFCGNEREGRCGIYVPRKVCVWYVSDKYFYVSKLNLKGGRFCNEVEGRVYKVDQNYLMSN